MPNTVLELEQTPVFECCVVGCESKTRHHKDMCWKEIELRAQISVTILDAIVNNIIGETCMIILKTHRNFTLTMNRIFIRVKNDDKRMTKESALCCLGTYISVLIEWVVEESMACLMSSAVAGSGWRAAIEDAIGNTNAAHRLLILTLPHDPTLSPLELALWWWCSNMLTSRGPRVTGTLHIQAPVAMLSM